MADVADVSVSAPATTSVDTSVASAAAPAAPATTGAQAETPTVETTTPAEKTFEPNAGEADADFFTRVMNEKSNPTEEKPAEKTPEEVAAAEAAKVVDPDAAVDDEDFDAYDPYAEEAGPLPPTELNAKIKASPELAALLEKDPEFKNTLFATARLASETAKYREVFSNPEEAQIAAKGNAEYSQLSELVTSIAKPEDAQGFYGRLMELSLLRDDAGEPLIDQASGKPMSDGTVGRLIHHTGALFLNHFEQLAKVDGKEDPELAAAVDILKARAFGRGTASTQEDFTEEQQAKAKELDQRETALNEQSKTAQEAKRQEYNDKIVTAIDTHSDAELGKLIARSDLPADQHADVSAKIRAAVYELVTANPSFHREQDALMQRQMGPIAQKERIALGNKWFNTLLPKVGPALLNKEGAKFMERQQKKQDSQAARVEASRSETSASLQTSRPLQLSSQQVNEKAYTDLQTKLGRAPEPHELFAEVMRVKSAA